MNSPESSLDDFINRTAKATVAVIVPLYGYWSDIPKNPVNGEVLDAVLARLHSRIHNIAIIFVANAESLPHDPLDPKSVQNILAAKAMAGNTKNVPVPRTATYAEYVREGFLVALHETDAQFMVVLNPWVLIQDGAIDAIVDRANRADDSKIISGYNVRSVIDPVKFDSYREQTPREQWDINFDFMAIPRYAAEMIGFDERYKTRAFQEVDIFQSMRQKGFGVISSQQIPIFTFDFPWKAYESPEMFEADRAAFIQKWSFDAGIKYGEEK